MDVSWTLRILCMHMTAQQYAHQRDLCDFRCLLGFKQGFPLSPTLFGLFVDGLERHLLDTSGIDAPTLFGTLVPLLLYADHLILMATTVVLQLAYRGSEMLCLASLNNIFQN